MNCSFQILHKFLFQYYVTPKLTHHHIFKCSKKKCGGANQSDEIDLLLTFYLFCMPLNLM